MNIHESHVMENTPLARSHVMENSPIGTEECYNCWKCICHSDLEAACIPQSWNSDIPKLVKFLKNY